MVGLTADDLEENLSKLSEESAVAGSGSAEGTVGIGGFYVKIDRPRGVISFRGPREPEIVLSDWAGDVGKMLTLMESTCHLINRETMVNKV
jgi:26S proteasome regulatory subunit N5